MLSDWCLDHGCTFALEMTNPLVELDALSDLRKPIADAGAVLRACGHVSMHKECSLDHSHTGHFRSCSGAKVAHDGKRDVTGIVPTS